MYAYLEKIGGILDLLYHHLPVLITDSWFSVLGSSNQFSVLGFQMETALE